MRDYLTIIIDMLITKNMRYYWWWGNYDLNNIWPTWIIWEHFENLENKLYDKSYPWMIKIIRDKLSDQYNINN